MIESLSQSLNESMSQSLPLSGFDKLADFALHQIPFQSADVADVELAIQMIDFMHEGAGQQFFSFFAGFLVPLSIHVLGANRYLARPGHGLAKLWNAEAAFRLGMFALGAENLRIH